MIRLLADENFHGDIVRGLLRRIPGIDLVRVQDVGLSGADDPSILAWAAEQERVLLTHDVATITRHAYERISAGLKMSGVIEVPRRVGIGQALDDLLLIVECSTQQEWENRLEYLPL